MDMQSKVEVPETPIDQAITAINMAPVQKADGQQRSGIVIGKNDVLFGRGGLTNRHYGNKKYRDVINEYRQEYVDAKKVEKPRVAKRVVKKILSSDFADTPVRFLKRDENGLWIEVDEHEAACKVSQALREKTRWSCMKVDEEEPSNMAVALKLEIEHSSETTTNKRAVTDNGEDEPKAAIKVLKVETTDKETGETKVKKIRVGVSDSSQQEVQPIAYQYKGAQNAREASNPAPEPETITKEIKLITPSSMVPTASQIPVPPLETVASSIFPKDGSGPSDADVLFGRGGRTNHHPGNKRLRTIVDQYKFAYEMAKKTDKPKYSKAIVQALREHENPSRFLRMNEVTNKWEDVGDRRAAEKVSQTLREKEKVKDNMLPHSSASEVAQVTLV